MKRQDENPRGRRERCHPVVSPQGNVVEADGKPDPDENFVGIGVVPKVGRSLWKQTVVDCGLH